MKEFILKNKVLVSAIVSALILTLQQALSSGSIDWKAIGFACLIAIIGVIANQWKGGGVTVLGILGTLAGVFHTIWTTGSFTWNEFILSAIVAILMAVSQSLQPAPQQQPNQFYH
ncbi:MAG TPA: hypothetical protein VFS36_06435 [Chitinophagaceae bacterium]|nr:hypothetical protein [Chitinophagaceae bacterium]